MILGFDASVLSEFRGRLIAGDRVNQLLDRMLSVMREQGLLKKPTQMRTDSTHVLAQARKTSRLVCVGETMRRVLNALATTVPEWTRDVLAQTQAQSWTDRYGHRVEEGRVPKGADARNAYMAQVGQDGMWLWERLMGETTPTQAMALPEVEVLRRIWLQRFVVKDGVLSGRTEEDGFPPSASRIGSPHEVEARTSQKRDLTWLGYKAHMSEVCDEGGPMLIAHVETTLSTTNDFDSVADIQQGLARKDLSPKTHLLDAGYMTSRNVLESQRDYGTTMIGPLHSAPDWQSKANAGYSIENFKIDWEHSRVTCPQGHGSTKWSQVQDAHGNPIINVRFPKTRCMACQARVRCTKSEARHITFRPKIQHEIIVAGRAYQQTAQFKATYAKRAGIEAIFSTATRKSGLRNARYCGFRKTHLQNVLTAIAINMRRLASWLAGEPLAQTRRQPFVTLRQLA